MQFAAYIKENTKGALKFSAAFFYWLALGAAVGALCGVIGALFSHAISFVTDLRGEYNRLVYLLPLGGIVSVALYKLCRVEGVGTNQVFEAVRGKKPVQFLLTPAVFIASVITHLLGGSAGKEGAALQLGGSVSSLVARALKLDDRSRHVLTVCGMGALFSAVFGTPLGACVFAVEVVRIGQIRSGALFPTLVSSVTAYGVAQLLHVHAERFEVGALPAFDLDTLWRMMIVAVVVALVSPLFCHLMHLSGKIFAKVFKNPFVRIVVGAAMIIVLTLLVGTSDYNGGGINVIERIFEEGSVRPEAFALKMLFTAITIGCGFKGGEIVPTFFIGATLGGTLAALVGLSPAFGAALGMAAMFCGVTNCPLATCFLCAEMFGGEGILFYAIAAFTGFILSGYVSLYDSQLVVYSKLGEEVRERE